MLAWICTCCEPAAPLYASDTDDDGDASDVALSAKPAAPFVLSAIGDAYGSVPTIV